MRLVETAVNLPQHTQDLLQLMAACEHPFEACGAVFKDGRVEQYENICDEPEHGFDAYIDFTPDIDMIWHSHPNGLEWPSRQDMPTMNAAAEEGHNFRWGIVTPGGLKVYVMQ